MLRQDNLDQYAKRAQMQADFINYVVKPLWSGAIVKLLPGLKCLDDNLAANLVYWRDEAADAKLKSQEASLEKAAGLHAMPRVQSIHRRGTALVGDVPTVTR